MPPGPPTKKKKKYRGPSKLGGRRHGLWRKILKRYSELEKKQEADAKRPKYRKNRKSKFYDKKLT